MNLHNVLPVCQKLKLTLRALISFCGRETGNYPRPFLRKNTIISDANISSQLMKLSLAQWRSNLVEPVTSFFKRNNMVSTSTSTSSSRRRVSFKVLQMEPQSLRTSDGSNRSSFLLRMKSWYSLLQQACWRPPRWRKIIWEGSSWGRNMFR